MHITRRKPNQCPDCFMRGHPTDGQYLGSRLTSKHFYRDYKCPNQDCLKPFSWQRTWRMGHSQPIVCTSCGEKGHEVHQIQTGKFRNETRRVIEVEVKCPKCGHLGWISIETEEIVML